MWLAATFPANQFVIPDRKKGSEPFFTNIILFINVLQDKKGSDPFFSESVNLGTVNLSRYNTSFKKIMDLATFTDNTDDRLQSNPESTTD